VTRPLSRLFLAAAALSAPIALLAAEADALAWLERMQGALTERTYRGEFSYVRDGELSSLAITHGRIDGVVRERLVHLDGPHREIHRIGERLSCLVEPGDPMLDHVQRVPVGPLSRAFLPGEVASGTRLSDRYLVRLAGTGRIAGEPVVRIDIVPDDETRYGYRLWLQNPTAMPLRAELLDPDARPLEIFQFVRVEVGAVLDESAFTTRVPGLVRHDFEVAAGSEETGSAHDWEASWLPAGFEMAAATLRRTPARAQPVQTLRYSDGIASLSVFVEPAWTDAGEAGPRRSGATSAVMRELEVAGGDRYLVTVVGEVPPETARRVADAVRPRS
jgi:sigma-E factor negative regulatory protein RseB